ncbi:MAG: nucleoside kinase [Eubacteriales bacterium]|nr:nucleoside kinase [Eubacteriales bacterium]
MAYELNNINLRTVSDPKGFCEECEAEYNEKVNKAAGKIADNLHASPIVLLSGPSGSGKTTTARKISEALNTRGIKTHYVSMDDYFKTVGEDTPRTAEGDYDLESPLCLDMELLNEHFTKLSEGKRIFVPKYEFSRRMRVSEPSKSIKLGKDEVCIFEGIHALNGAITGMHDEAFRLYVSARSNVNFNDSTVFKSTWFRLVRRTVRDFNFRGTDAEETMKMWANVRRGEKLYISPFRTSAHYQFDTSMPCELAVMNGTATELFRTVPEGIERYEELRSVLPALQLFGRIDEKDVPEDSLLREFIGYREDN